MLLRDFVDKINVFFAEALKGAIPDLKTFGIAQSIIRTAGSEQEMLPGVVDKGTGEITYVGIDDTDAVRIYHRNPGLNVTRSATNRGVGDEYPDLVNTYQMAMIVFVDHKKAKMYPEELFLYLQANFPDALKSKPYKTITVNIGNIILNSQLVFRAEYAGAKFELPADKSLFQVNYTIQTTFSKKCFEKCPC